MGCDKKRHGKYVTHKLSEWPPAITQIHVKTKIKIQQKKTKIKLQTDSILRIFLSLNWIQYNAWLFFIEYNKIQFEETEYIKHIGNTVNLSFLKCNSTYVIIILGTYIFFPFNRIIL